MKTLKNAFVFVMVLALLVGNAALAFAEGPSGSASATAQGLEETVTVTVEVEDGVITAVTAETDKEEATVGQQALTQIPEAILAANSVKVDGVTGATFSSEAIIQNVQLALDYYQKHK